MKTLKLNNGITIPHLGFGVFQISDEKECEDSVVSALRCGYRLIDTAACYGNEAAVGNAVLKSGIAREDICIVSKVWIQDAGYEKTMTSFYQTLEHLQTDYLDLYLIHMPYGDYHGSWRAMEELYQNGSIKAIGVCNFTQDRLVDLILSHEIMPAINQIELHPYYQQVSLREVMNRYDIKAMAWAPFAQGRNGIFHDCTLSEIAQVYHKTTAQIILQWQLQQGIIAIPKSVHEQRIRQNFEVDDILLSDEDMKSISLLDQKQPLILPITSIEEVYRLHNITF